PGPDRAYVRRIRPWSNWMYGPRPFLRILYSYWGWQGRAGNGSGHGFGLISNNPRIDPLGLLDLIPNTNSGPRTRVRQVTYHVRNGSVPFPIRNTPCPWPLHRSAPNPYRRPPCLLGVWGRPLPVRT